MFSDSVEEKVRLVETLVKATGGRGWMHESFDVGKSESVRVFSQWRNRSLC